MVLSDYMTAYLKRSASGDLIMRFGRSVLRPSYSRIPDFKNFDYKDGKWGIRSRLREYFNREFKFRCINCNKRMAVEYDLLIDKGSGWKQKIGEALAREAIEFYKIGAVGKSHDGGWPAMIKVECPKCKARYLVYAGVNEIHNSAHLVTIQGITEIVEVKDRNK